MMLQASGAVPTSARDLIINAGLETHVVLVILIVLSLVSWTIMFAVGRQLSKSLRLATGFAREVERASRLAAAGEVAKHATPNAAQRVLIRALHFVGDDARPRFRRRRQHRASKHCASYSTPKRCLNAIDLDAFFRGSQRSDRRARSSGCSAPCSASSRPFSASRREGRGISPRLHPAWPQRSWRRRQHSPWPFRRPSGTTFSPTG